ncbi:MAG TPA: PAS-domain containing protein, partial [Burkholderiales bacterium]|nr:PAS-domain containing protein [Burkholderiales bacterium]
LHRGLVGRAVAAKKAVHASDISDKTVEFVYLDEARAAGLTSGIVLPVMTGGCVIAVLEFYATARVEKDSTLLAALDQVARHIGHVAERIQARASHQRLAAAIEGIGDGVALFDKDERLLLFNRRYAAEFSVIADVFKPGLTFESFIRALTRKGYFHQVNEDWIRTRLRRFRAREDVEHAVSGANGRPEWRAVRHHLTPNGETLVVLSDITARKRAEQELESSRYLLRTALDSMTDGVALYDKDERLVLFNESYVRNIMLSREIVKPGISFPELTANFAAGDGHIGADEGWMDERIRRFRALEPVEMCLHDPDGSERWYNVHLYRTRDGGTFLVRTDITERKRAEAELESAQQLLQTALDSMTDGVALFDKDERLVLWNENYTRNFPTLRGIPKLGITFPEIVRTLSARQSYVGEGEDFVAARLRKFRTLETAELRVRDSEGDHWLVARHHRTRDGGT